VPAHPHAYDDLWRVYAEEISAYHRGVLRAPRRCVGSWVYDRFNNRRPSLAETDKSPDSAIITDQAKPFAWSPRYALIDAVPDAVAYKTSEQARKAGRSGGAANKRRWEKIKAARQEAAARRRARSAKP
jgi:hypothetical protein